LQRSNFSYARLDLSWAGIWLILCRGLIHQAHYKGKDRKYSLHRLDLSSPPFILYGSDLYCEGGLIHQAHLINIFSV
jgi:hypothetical protein